MTDKIKFKADKFVNDKKLKLNYIKPKDLKILLAEFCEEQIAELKAECDLAIEGRDVKIKELELTAGTLRTFSNEQASCVERLKKEVKMLGERCLELQKDKGELIDRIKKLEQQNEQMQCCGNCKNEGDYKEPYRYGTGWCNICKRHKVAKGNFDKQEIKEK